MVVVTDLKLCESSPLLTENKVIDNCCTVSVSLGFTFTKPLDNLFILAIICLQSHFKIKDYMCRQPDLNASMRALVVNWMVEVQENFELNHETLYLGVKLVDLYLSKVRITKNKLQLIACASLFVAAKYDVSLF